MRISDCSSDVCSSDLSNILHEEIRQLREENHTIRVDYEDIRQQQQDASQIADMMVTQRVDELKEKHDATLDKLHQQRQRVLQDFATYATQDTIAFNTSTIRERLDRKSPRLNSSQ